MEQLNPKPQWHGLNCDVLVVKVKQLEENI